MAHPDRSPRSLQTGPDLKVLKPLRVDIDSLELAFESHEVEAEWYLDLSTGEVELVTDEDAKHAISADPERLACLPDWQRESVGIARRVLRQVGSRFVVIPQDEPSDAWDDMAAWIDEVDDAAIRRQLRQAIRGKAAFRAFRAILYEEDRLDEFSMFQQARLRQRIVEWLASLGIGAMYDE